MLANSAELGRTAAAGGILCAPTLVEFVHTKRVLTSLLLRRFVKNGCAS
jgi:hypothetical protein